MNDLEAQLFVLFASSVSTRSLHEQAEVEVRLARTGADNVREQEAKKKVVETIGASGETNVGWAEYALWLVPCSILALESRRWAHARAYCAEMFLCEGLLLTIRIAQTKRAYFAIIILY